MSISMVFVAILLAESGIYGFRLPRQLQPQLLRLDAVDPTSNDGITMSTTTTTTSSRRPPLAPPVPNFFDRGGLSISSPLDGISTRRMSEASSLFTWDSYRALNVSFQDNVFYSPYSIMNALGMLTLGSSGSTADQLKDVLRFDPIGRRIGDSFHRSLGLENQKLINDKTSVFAVGNRFFVDRQSASNINPDYLQDLHDYYNSSMKVVNFSTDPRQATQTINDWVSQSTLGKINNFLPGELDPQTKLILVNTIYFSGRWALPFNQNLTAVGDFQTTNGLVKVPYMYLQGPLQYAKDKDLGIETVILPYQTLKYAMHIILPSAKTDLASVEPQLSAGYLQKLSRQAFQNPVVLKMPKFSLKQRLSLRDMLGRLNVTDVFNPLKSDFSGIFVNSRPGLLVDDVIHEAVLEVDEEGTVAAAATAILVVRIAQPTQFVTVDRPFIFYISDESNDVILFWGRVTNPSP